MGMSSKFTSRSGLNPNPIMPVHEPASSVAPSTTSEQFQAAGQGTGQTNNNDPTKMNPEKEEDEMEDDEIKESSNPGSSNAESYNVNGKKDGAIDSRTFTEKFQAAEQATEQSSENMVKPTTYNDPTKIKMDPELEVDEMEDDEMEDDEMKESNNAGSNGESSNVDGKKGDAIDTRSFSEKFQKAGSSEQQMSSTPSDFLPTQALLFARFSQVAYCESTELEEWSNCHSCTAADPNFHVSKVIKGIKAMSQVFVGVSKKGIVISFRGTLFHMNNIPWYKNENLIKDAEAWMKSAFHPKCTGCEVHYGFLESWIEVKNDVIKEVGNLLLTSPEAKVFVTGHSYGAAMAVLCAADLGSGEGTHLIGGKIEAVYTFGQPRVGNQAFRDFYATGEHVSWRVTHYKDIVPHVPTEGDGILGFQHTSTFVVLFYSIYFISSLIWNSSFILHLLLYRY